MEMKTPRGVVAAKARPHVYLAEAAKHSPRKPQPTHALNAENKMASDQQNQCQEIAKDREHRCLAAQHHFDFETMSRETSIDPI